MTCSDEQISLEKASGQILNWRWTFIDVQYSWRMVFLILKKRNLHILSFGEDSSLNKEVPDIKRAAVSVQDTRGQSAVFLARRQTLMPMDLYLTQLDHLQLGKCVSPKMSCKSSPVHFPCSLVGYKARLFMCTWHCVYLYVRYPSAKSSWICKYYKTH